MYQLQGLVSAVVKRVLAVFGRLASAIELSAVVKRVRAVLGRLASAIELSSHSKALLS